MEFKVDGYRHIKCLCFSKVGMPFDGFTCEYCKRIMTYGDFQMRVYLECNAIEKRGSRNTSKGRHLITLVLKS